MATKGDVSGVICYRYHRGRDGEGTCNTCCQWWPKDQAGNPEKVVCPFWVSPELWDSAEDLPKGKDGKYLPMSFEEFEKRYNTKITIEEKGAEPPGPQISVIVAMVEETEPEGED